MILRCTAIILALAGAYFSCNAQQKQTDTSFRVIDINGYRTVNGVGRLLDLQDGIIYAGKKTEVILTDSIDANKAINNTRQILGRIPGLNIVETESAGFTANGIATRGLNPTQSVEMNTRQNGYNISADIYGYNEAYYLPSMEAVSRIEMVRGASALQFGSQFGGLVNYVIKDGSDKKPFEFNTSETVGSFGMYNLFNSVGGTYKKIKYYAYAQYRQMYGYRPNSQQWQLSGYGKISYKASKKLNFGAEYSLLRNQIKMPGGLTDSMFNANPRMSTRSRNWLRSPWNVIAAYATFTPSSNTTITWKTAYIFSGRALVWRNEDGGPGAADDVDSTTHTYVPREVGKETMHGITSELRFSNNYKLGHYLSTIAGGVRVAHSWFTRQGGGEGTTNSDFDLSITGDWGYNLNFTTTNVAPFVENIFRINNKLTITPGFRIEYLKSTSSGYKFDDTVKQYANQSRNRFFPLFGTGVEFKPTKTSSIYANFTQAYRPIDYSQLEPFGVTSRIDKNLKDSKGFNSDIGYRGTVKNILNFDLGAFYMAYNNRIGIVQKRDPVTSETYTLRTNVANSRHMGLETYVELNIVKAVYPRSKFNVSVFNSFAYIDAKYTSGEYKGNRVEAAAKTINRSGIILSSKHISATAQFSYVGDAYGDASNAIKSNDPVAGHIPSYTIVDLSASYKFNRYAIKFGVNNLANHAYFTRRTDEYPGPGIIPAVGRSIYLGISARF